jgi:hypothetical protein
MSRQNKKGTGTKGKVLKVLRSGYCNTSQDVADEIGITATRASAYISALVRQRRICIKRTGRWLPNVRGWGRRLRVFEVVNA